MISPDSIGPAPNYKEYTSFATEINLLSESELGGIARRIYVADAGGGTKKVALRNPAGVERTFTVASGALLELQACAILPATTVTTLLVLL